MYKLTSLHLLISLDTKGSKLIIHFSTVVHCFSICCNLLEFKQHVFMIKSANMHLKLCHSCLRHVAGPTLMHLWTVGRRMYIYFKLKSLSLKSHWFDTTWAWVKDVSINQCLLVPYLPFSCSTAWWWTILCICTSKSCDSGDEGNFKRTDIRHKSIAIMCLFPVIWE